MPVIFSGTEEKGKIILSESLVDHESNYALFYLINKEYKSFRFCESYFSNEKSLFYADNRKTMIFRWFEVANQLALHNMDKNDHRVHIKKIEISH